MHTDTRNLENNSLIQGDICIVGAGAAGISIALDWKDTAHKVILLEGGGFEYEDQVQDLMSGTTSGQRYFPLRSTRLHYFGGATGHWAGMCSPFDPIDFIDRSWVPYSGWPISREDLDPYYSKAHVPLQLGPYEYELEYWDKELPNLNPLPFDEKVVWNKMWQFTTANFGPLYKDELVAARNIELCTYAHATSIRLKDGSSEADHIVIKNHAGKTHRVRAKHYLLACGTLQNTRLLLASNDQRPEGLGNDHDLVGRFFMEHLEIPVADLWMADPFPTDLYSWKYGHTKAAAELAITAAIQEKENILNGTLSLRPLVLGKHTKARMDTWQNEDPRKSQDNMFRSWDEALAAGKQEKGAIERAFELNIRIEQCPNPESRLTLTREKDALGVPRTNLNWALTGLDKYSVRRIAELIGQQAGLSGTGRVQLREFLRDKNDSSFPDTTNGGWHHMGTTRMSTDPKNGVVDPECRVHGIPNLHIAGAACYPTSGAPNPTLTLTALSLRLSDRVKTLLKRPV
ncbi:FAD-dependent oxidoreductase [Zeaxanthinibacter enoshimensis]|uniref:Choline dehydrogenase-like flavoprotein n=1 Tax=Zeaxanthinibacter enoshimensis TaxID=392009 RepID=A0A4R6TNG2_9FLAO|nr:GMC family oxidoreductase [Zeaxanthinibacter enoshimensis]TDQ33064.1 choline dehydrogenase-like flavoprotein [Zeaxanthinibacter enoshimensis]